MAYGTRTLPLQTYKDWVAQTDLANLYFAGRYVGENGYWRVGENGPSAAVGNPILFGRYAAGYKGAALFDDSAILLNVSGVTGSPFYWPGKGFSKSLTGGALPTYRLDFVFELFGSSSKVSFTFHVSPLGISREPGLRWTNTTTNLDLAGIDYVYVSTQRFRDLNRFLSDPEYMMVHVNSDIAIFQRVYS